MNKPIKTGLMVSLAAVALALGAGCATTGKSENDLVAALASPNQDTARAAIAELEARYPQSPTWQPAVRKMLADPREEVALKAVRVLGIVHAEVTDEDLKNITALFRASRPNVAMGALKGLRGLKAQSIIPQILPLLQNHNAGIVRDALRTLAVLGDSSLVPQIEPLLNHPNSAVKKDAMECVTALKAKG